MNRRSFLDAMLKGVAAFTILPSAGRIWKAERWLPNNANRIIVNSLWDTDLYNRLPYYLAKITVNAERERMAGFHSAAFERLVLGDWPPNKTEVTQRPIFSDLNERHPIRQISTVRVRV